MSAFIVDEETIHKAVHLMRTNRHAAEDSDQLGNRLWQLNAEAVAQRYPDHERFEPPCYRWCGLKHYPVVVALKGLQCLIYQCSEGDVRETQLYKDMRKTELRTLHDIVRALPEYEAAAWGSP